MWRLTLELTLELALVLALARGAWGARYGFYRRLGGAALGAGEGGRRVFGGAAAPLAAHGAVCALLDEHWAPRCSGAVLAPRWVLTAGHCVTPQVALVKYNARRVAPFDGNVASVLVLYRHPGYEVKLEDEGLGEDVTLLRHDLGLVRTRRAMRLAQPPAVPALPAIRRHNLLALDREEVAVLGFGRTEAAALGEELLAVRLRLVSCERAAWEQCACGTSRSLPGGARGVCSGDSGGPVLFAGAQVGVTSMGPVECAASEPPADATSVFTALYSYADMINATIFNTDEAMRMRKLNRAPAAAPPAPHLLATPLLVLLLR